MISRTATAHLAAEEARRTISPSILHRCPKTCSPCMAHMWLRIVKCLAHAPDQRIGGILISWLLPRHEEHQTYYSIAVEAELRYECHCRSMRTLFPREGGVISGRCSSRALGKRRNS